MRGPMRQFAPTSSRITLPLLISHSYRFWAGSDGLSVSHRMRRLHRRLVSSELAPTSNPVGQRAAAHDCAGARHLAICLARRRTVTWAAESGSWEREADEKGGTRFVCSESAPPGGVDWSSAQTRDKMTRDIHASSADDRTIRLLLDVHPAFEGLRTVAGQLAGLLILAAAGRAKVAWMERCSTPRGSPIRKHESASLIWRSRIRSFTLAIT
jgi:hypothetical protein